MRALLFAVLLAGCSSPAPGADDVVTPDAVTLPACDPTAAFGAPVAVGGLDGTADEGGAGLSADERTVYFHRLAPGGDLFSATRGDAAGTFGTAAALTALNQTSADELSPSVSADGLMMVFTSNRGGTLDLFLADRDTTGGAFAVVSQIVALNSGSADTDGYLTADAGEVWFASDRDGDFDLFRATASGSTFDTDLPVTELNTGGPDTNPVVTDDGLTIFFERDTAIFTATRATASGAFSGVTQLTALGAGSPVSVSPGGCRLYFESDRAGNTDIFVAARPE